MDHKKPWNKWNLHLSRAEMLLYTDWYIQWIVKYLQKRAKICSFFATWGMVGHFPKYFLTVQPTFVLTKASVWNEMRVIWVKINHVKSHAMILAFSLQTDMNQIHQMRYCTSLHVKRLQKYQRSKLEVEKNLPDQPGPKCIGFETGRVGNFLPTSNFDLWYFCSLFIYKSGQYLIWKIWFISVWRLKSKVMAWLLA